MAMPGRGFSSGSYRYGFNGQEKSDELGSGLTTALFWEYDSRIGRRWNLDPLPNPSMGSYSCLNDNPLWFSDVLGNVPKRKHAPNKNGPSFSVFGIPFFTGELLYKKIHDIDLKYAKSRRGKVHTFSFAVPFLGTVHLMGLQREGDREKAEGNRIESEKASPGTKGLLIDGTAGREVPYAFTKQGGKYAYREITDAKDNSDHGTALRMFYKEENVKDGQWFVVPMVEASENTRVFLNLFRLAKAEKNANEKENSDGSSQKQAGPSTTVPVLRMPVPSKIPERIAAITRAPAPSPARALAPQAPTQIQGPGLVDYLRVSNWYNIFFGVAARTYEFEHAADLDFKEQL